MNKNKIHRICWLLFALLLLSGCQDYYLPDLKSTEPILVVDGMMTNQNEKVTVVLTRTVPFSKRFTYNAETGANVILVSNRNKLYDFSEVSSGIYQSNNKIEAYPGESYYLFISTSNNEEYRSEWQTLNEPSPVGKIMVNDTTLMIEKFNAYGVPILSSQRGLFFQIKPEVPSTSQIDYLFRWKANFNYVVGTNEPIEMMDYQYYCWKENLSNNIMFYNYYKPSADGELPAGNLMFLSRQIIDPFPIDSASFLGDITYVYTAQMYVQLKQYTVSATCGEFWQQIYNQSIATGKLFDPVESQIYGNIYCTSDTTKMALGFFEVAGYSEKIIKVINSPTLLNNYLLVKELPDMTGADTCYRDQQPYFW